MNPCRLFLLSSWIPCITLVEEAKKKKKKPETTA